MFIMDMMQIELKRIDWLIRQTEAKLRKLDGLPEATLVCEVRGLSKIYYYAQNRINGKQSRNYIGKPESETVKQYKLRRFFRETLKALRFDNELLRKCIKQYIDYSPESIHKKLPSSYKNLPDACYKNEKYEELKKWAAEKYERNSYPLPVNPSIARDGTPMRSKGECMWYDDILFEDIPVRVDPKVTLKGASGKWHTLCPDFLFKCFDGEHLAVEHFGKWDEDEYASKNAKKIQDYLDCGFVLGDNLIVTSDNAQHNTDERMILEALEKIKKRVFGL